MQELSEARADLSIRLRGRQEELERAAMAQLRELPDAGELRDPDYLEGLQEAISDALDCGIASISVGDPPPPVPESLLAQARLAARSGVKLDTVLRRYVAGYHLLGNALSEEAESAGPLGRRELKGIRRALQALFDRILEQVGAAYDGERGAGAGTSEQRQIEKVRRLLDGEEVDAHDLAYDFDLHHVGLIASGPQAPAAIAELARRADRRRLSVRLGQRTVWAWLGSRDPETLPERKLLIARHWPPHIPLSVGEPSAGADGWRLTHRQARAAHSIPLGKRPKRVHYAEFALVASIRDDELLTSSLREIYLKPLSRDRDGGDTLLRTLRAHLDADGRTSSTAAVLGVSRQAVGTRLKKAERRLGRPLNSCLPELDVALRLSGLDPRRTAG